MQPKPHLASHLFAKHLFYAEIKNRESGINTDFSFFRLTGVGRFCIFLELSTGIFAYLEPMPPITMTRYKAAGGVLNLRRGRYQKTSFRGSEGLTARCFFSCRNISLKNSTGACKQCKMIAFCGDPDRRRDQGDAWRLKTTFLYLPARVHRARINQIIKYIGTFISFNRLERRIPYLCGFAGFKKHVFIVKKHIFIV